MDKSIHAPEYAALLGLLREARVRAGLTQTELARRVGTSQSFITKVETGERRLDVIQLRTLCLALETTLVEVVARLEERLAEQGRCGR